MTMRAAAHAASIATMLLTCGPPCLAAGYAIDDKHTEVRFACAMGLATERGHFTGVEGHVDYEPAGLERTAVAASIATGSLTTGDAMIDETLKGSDFFNVRAFPAMTFVSRSVRSTGPKTAEMTGDITVNGVTRPVSLAVSIAPYATHLKYGGERLEFVARTRIKRSAFNMTAYQSMASDDVDIEIDAVLRRSP
jgi:polyisoprenoid-binding protein YceI